MMAVPITPSGAELKSGEPQLLFGNYLGDGDSRAALAASR